MWEDIRWVFFDLGSTLLDETLAYQHRLLETAQLARVPYEQVRAMVVAFCKENKKGDYAVAEALHVRRPPWPSALELVYPETEPLLTDLAPKYHLGVLANQPLGTAKRLAQRGLLPYFDLVLSSEEEGLSKPDPAFFHLALERAKCAPWQALMVGDRLDNDIAPAKALGMATCWVRQGFAQYWTVEDEAHRPQLTLDSIGELRRYL